MKKLFVIMFVMLAATVAAQPGGGRNMGTAEERAKRQTDNMTELLSLNAEQKTKISAIELDIQKQMDTRRQNTQGNREAMMTAMQEIEKVREDKYKAVLTADQFKKYVDDREQRRGQGGGRGQGGQGGQGQRAR